MPDYIVVNDCYVPVGDADGLKFKRAGQRVSLATSEANKLVGFVKPVNSFKVRKPKPAEPVASALDLDDPRHDENVVGVQKLNTPEAVDDERD